ncbi:MAG: flagellar biosynthesis anti-sigma factor FlgM [Spirochaetales bacterium]|nr:flagellar biosynthesis anti-sigma factor FlgM [Spirochaetales bacterium]
MNINSLGHINSVTNQKKTDKVSKPVDVGGKDSIKISNDAKAMAEMYAVSETVKTAPDVRMDRIEEVREKLKDPSYIDSKIIESVAESVLDVFGLS